MHLLLREINNKKEKRERIKELDREKKYTHKQQNLFLL